MEVKTNLEVQRKKANELKRDKNKLIKEIVKVSKQVSGLGLESILEEMGVTEDLVLNASLNLSLKNS